MDLICSHDYCTGCQACRLVCPKHCISMSEDDKGNIYPIVDQSLCIDCKKCQKACPSLKPPTFSIKPIKVYAGWAKDKKARKYSTSGAISYVLSKYFLQSGNVFCGAIWTEEGAIHKVSTSIDEVKLFQGSKYSHSDVKNCYEEVRQYLLLGKKVLFTGTPCQVAALRKYLKKDYEGLYTVDLVCHGVPSKRVLRDRIKAIEKEQGKHVVEMRFRDKQPDQFHTCCKYTFNDGTFVLHEYRKDFFFRSFVDNYILRENCFNCQYSRLERVSDITIADFWGFSARSMKFYKFELGVSIIIVNTNHGQELLNLVKDEIIIEERSVKECDNQNLHAAQLKPKNYDEYWVDYNSGIDKECIQEKYLSKPIPFKRTYRQHISKFANAFLPVSMMDKVSSLLSIIRK